MSEKFEDDWALAVAMDLLDNGKLDAVFTMIDKYPVIAEIPEPIDDEGDLDFEPTEESFERLKQKLIDDGLWKEDK